MKRKKIVHLILSPHRTKFYEARVNSSCTGKLLIKVNIVQTQLWEKPIYKLLSCFWQQHILCRLFIRFFFFFLGGGRDGTNQLHVNALTHVPFITSFTNEQSILIWEVDSRYLLLICCKVFCFLFQIWRFCKSCFRSGGL